MKSIILDGKKVQIQIKGRITQRLDMYGRKPHLVIIQVGDNAQSNIYIRQKIIFGESVGVRVSHIRILDAQKSDVALLKSIEDCNGDPTVHGIIVQLPLPENILKDSILNTIDPLKDADGLTNENRTFLESAKPRVVPATARGIFELLDAYDVNVRGKKIVVVGRSDLVGKPTALLAQSRGGLVTVVHSKTENPKALMRSADILIVAAGVKHLIGVDSVSNEQVVIDVGMHVDEADGVRILTGDVDFENVSQLVKAISPVPGGVGPLTVASLYLNLLDLYDLRNKA